MEGLGIQMKAELGGLVGRRTFDISHSRQKPTLAVREAMCQIIGPTIRHYRSPHEL